MPITLSPAAWMAIETLIQLAVRKIWNQLEGKTEAEIIQLAKLEEQRSELLQKRQEGGSV